MKYLPKEEAVLDMAAGKRVLHLGCVGMTDAAPDERIAAARTSLHARLSAVADVVGIDYSADVIAEYARLGLFTNIAFGNVEKLETIAVEGPFDVVVVGDIIEHLTSPGAMLEGLKRFVNEHSQIIITTPHSFGLPNFIRFALGRFREGAEHVMCFNAITLQQMLERHGYVVEEVHTCYQPHAQRRTFTFRIGRACFSYLPRFGGTLYVVARHPREEANPSANRKGVRSAGSSVTQIGNPRG